MVSAANSFVGSNVGVHVGIGGIVSLIDGNYVILSPDWNGSRGAVTWGIGTVGLRGVSSTDNSLLGSNRGDRLGSSAYLDLHGLSNGDYLVISPQWNGNRGAVTWINGTTGQPLNGLGAITPQNSLLGTASVAASSNLDRVLDNPIAQTFLAVFFESGGRVTVGLTDPSQLTYAAAQGQSLTITSQFLTHTLETGTAVVLQASNDITVQSPITVNSAGNGGALTLEAGRSLVLNASISTDNGALILLANDILANGAVDAERDPGSAVIRMASGTTLDTGSGPLTVELREGAGLTNSDSGAITLQSVAAGSVALINDGPSAGSDVNLGSVTTSGVQSYADPNGITQVSGNLTATNPITFYDSVVLDDHVRLDAGFGTINFAASGLQTLESGVGATLGNVLHNGTGTLQLTSSLTIRGALTNQSGTFDANNQLATVSGLTTLAGGTYLAGTAPQSFNGGLVVLTGVFRSSTGPINVSGGILLANGQFSGVGTVDTLTTFGGTIAPGGASPGVLSVTGALVIRPESTVSILLNGVTAGTGYAQLQAGGPIALGGSTLNLTFGFVPPVASSFEILTNTGSLPVSGTFDGLAEGAVFTQGGYQFQITYQGGTGGDSVVLTRLA
jgi:hypothetical protein